MPQVFFLPTAKQTGSLDLAIQAGASTGNLLGRTFYDTEEEKKERDDQAGRRAQIDLLEADLTAQQQENEQTARARKAAEDLANVLEIGKSAQTDPTLAEGVREIIKQGISMPPEEQQGFFAGKLQALLDLREQGKREQEADTLLGSLRGEAIAEPGWDLVAPAGEDGKPEMDPSIQGVQDLIKDLREGRITAEDARKRMGVIRAEQKEERKRLRARNTVLQRGERKLEELEAAGFMPGSNAYDDMNDIVESYRGEELTTPQYLDRYNELTTGRPSGASPMDPDQIMKDARTWAMETIGATGDPEDEDFFDRVEALAERNFVFRTGGAPALKRFGKGGGGEDPSGSGAADAPKHASFGMAKWGTADEAKQTQVADKLVSLLVAGNGNIEEHEAAAAELGVDLSTIPKLVRDGWIARAKKEVEAKRAAEARALKEKQDESDLSDSLKYPATGLPDSVQKDQAANFQETRKARAEGRLPRKAEGTGEAQRPDAVRGEPIDSPPGGWSAAEKKARSVARESQEKKKRISRQRRVVSELRAEYMKRDDHSKHPAIQSILALGTESANTDRPIPKAVLKRRIERVLIALNYNAEAEKVVAELRKKYGLKEKKKPKRRKRGPSRTSTSPEQ